MGSAVPPCGVEKPQGILRAGTLASAVPMKVFGHVVYSWTCKHLYLYARSRRTSGQPWRPGSSPRPPLPYDAAKSSSPVPRVNRPPRLRTTCAAPIRPSATRCMPSTSAASRCCSPSRPDRTPPRPFAMLGSANPSGRCCTRVHGRSASPRAGGRSRWPPRSVSPRASHRAWSATKPFVWPSAGWACHGNAPNTGSPAPIRPMPEKKTARPAHPAGQHPADVGAGVWRRSLVESARPAQSALLDRGRGQA